MKNDYYTYAYLREDGTPYYIGKGKGKRCFQNSGRTIPCPPKERVLILKKNLTEEEAFRHEIYLIAILGRKDLGTGFLRNLTEGGEGISGYQHSEEVRAKIGEASKRRVVSEKTRAKIREARKRQPAPSTGKTHSEETRAKMSAAKKGKKLSEETRARMSAAQKGKTLTAETRAKISATLKQQRGSHNEKTKASQN